MVSTLQRLREEGTAHFAEGRLDEAIQSFRRVMNIFSADQCTKIDGIDDFAKAAGNLCVCLLQKGERDLCFRTAREALGTYPVIPKAFAAIGMCIMDQVEQQEAEWLAAHLPSGASPVERNRVAAARCGEADRYVVSLGNLRCTPDDAHVFLCRAVMLSEGSLQASLGPYLQAAVRWISEQLVTGPHAVQQALGKGETGSSLLDRLCPVVEFPSGPPPLLATARAEMQDQLRSLNLMGGGSTPVSDLTGELRAQIEAQRRAQGGDGEVEEVEPLLEAVDFMLSGERMPVHVCQHEPGLPRGLLLTESAVPFGVGHWIPEGGHPRVAELPSAEEAPPSAMGTSGLLLHQSGLARHTDVCCLACGKDMMSCSSIAACDRCQGVMYCSAACQATYGNRHSTYECAMRQALQKHLEMPDQTYEPQSHNSDPSIEIIGKGWSVYHLHHGVLPLCIATLSGIRCRAPGWERIVAQLRLGVGRHLQSAIPASVNTTIQLIADNLPEDACTTDFEGMTHRQLLHGLLLLCRLHQVSRGDSYNCSFLFTESLRLRHSCEPNCTWSATHRCFMTSRFVHAGEELTTSIHPDTFPQHWPWQVRQKWLVCYQGFYCQCARCHREHLELNKTRGNLSSDLTEQLLSGDILHRNRSKIEHPTHHYHLRVQNVVQEALRGGHDIEAVAKELTTVQQELQAHLLSTHYLLEDIRKALTHLAMRQHEATLCTAVGRSSLLFYEALWAGAIPSKILIMQDLPQPFETSGRRRLHHRRMRRRPNSAGGVESEPEKAPEASMRDYSEGTVVDLFYGSYQAWYL